MRQPAIFLGHGTPMNAIENNKYSYNWAKLGRMFKPSSILMISAHWFTEGLKTQSAMHPEKINDMYGFPKELYETEYPVEGNPELTERIGSIFGDEVVVDDSWGIDHGAWSVLLHMYPKADVPVVQLSVNKTAEHGHLLEIGMKLSDLRDEGVMIIGSGNIVHNLRMINPRMEKGYEWAERFDKDIKAAVKEHHFFDCINYSKFRMAAEMSVPTPDHFLPLIYVLGAVRQDDKLSIFNEGSTMGGMSMTSFLFDKKLTL